MATMTQMRRWNGLATDCRDAVYGRKARPLGWRLRLEWARVCRAMTRSGSLRLPDVRRVAAAFGEDVRRENPTPEATPEFDAMLRKELAARLRAEAKKLGRPRMTAEQCREGRIRTLAKG